MTPEFCIARGYLAFDGVIRDIDRWLERQAPSVCGYSSNAVANRLTQRVMEITLRSFMQEGARRYDAGIRTLPSQDRLMRCAGAVVNTATGKTRPSLVLLGRSVAEFLLHWAHTLFVHLLSSMHATRRSRGPAVVLFGVGSGDLKAGSSDARFIEYFRKGPIVPLARAQRLVVQAAGQATSSRPEFVSYSRRPLHALVRENPMGIGQFMGFLLQHFYALVSYFVAIVRCPLVSVLGMDFAYHAMVSCLNRRGLIECVVITYSNYLSQPLWMNDIPDRRFVSHMVWYAVNDVPPVYKADPVIADPGIRHIRVDEGWTWADWHVRDLKRLGVKGVMHVVGPILWYLPQPAQAGHSREDIRIAVFDVTPKSGLIHSYSYYCAENMTRFIEDIVCACAAIEQATGRRVRILLKHKRSYHSSNDPGYISLIKKISGPGQPVELLPLDTNMYSLISGCDLTLVIPYSSPAYVATSLGCQAIYYDPTMEVQPVYNKQPFLTFVAGRANLVNAMMGIGACQ